MGSHQHHDLVPLAALISREMKSEKMEKPTVRYGYAAQSRKVEDYFMMKTDYVRVPGQQSTSFSVFAVFDGHNGNAAALYSRDNLLNHILSAIPRGLGREEWLQALPRALVAGFVKTDKEFQSKGQTSGTTATFVIVDRGTVTVASVGDSRCILDTQVGGVSVLTVDHRLEENLEERERVKASGREVGRLSILGGAELSNAGGRLIIASDGIWDAVSSEMAAKSCRGLPAELAARQVVKEALRTRGLRDDTTCIVVDIIPPDNAMPPPSPPRKKQSKLKSFFLRAKSLGSISKMSKKLSAVGIVEELLKKVQPCLQKDWGMMRRAFHQHRAFSFVVSVKLTSQQVKAYQFMLVPSFQQAQSLGKVLFCVRIVVIRKMQWRENGQVESKSPNTHISFHPLV